MEYSSTMTVEKAWKTLVSHLDPPATLTPELKSECKELIEVLENLGYPVRRCLGSWYRVKFKYFFKSDIMPEVKGFITQHPTNQYRAFKEIIYYLGQTIPKFLLTFYLLEETDSTFNKQMIYSEFTSLLLNDEPIKSCFSDNCSEFYKRGFDIFDNLVAMDIGREGNLVEHSEELAQFDLLNRYISCLYLFEDVAFDSALLFLNSQIKLFITENFSACSLYTSIIDPVMSFLASSVVPFIHFITQHLLSPPDLDIWKKRLKFFSYKTIASVRINDLFEIMVDYPDSHEAVQDIRTCLGQVQCSEYLVMTVQDTFKERLLHPGANTEDVITQYSSAIKVLRFLDPSGAILERVCTPLRMYLKNRADTIRCILNSLISQEETELSRELTASSGAVFQGSEDSDLETEEWEKWQPQTKEMPSEINTSKSGDIISTLCSIYGSSDLFVNEYQSLIAEKLLTTSNYDISCEMRSLELLKIGFGEELGKCNIMLQDIIDSKRTHMNIMNKIKAESKPMFDMNTIILSHVYWPNLRNEEVTVYKPLQDFLENDYKSTFSELKRSRTLDWKLNLGFVDLDLEFENQTVSFTVSPVQATIILCFEENEKCHADTLSQTIGLSLSQTRKKLAFWVANGVLKETSKDMFEIKKEVSNTRQVVVEEMESAMVKIEQVREEELEGFTNFVMGLIHQSGQITVDRVHKLLSMLLADSVAGQLTTDEVKTFLDLKVKSKLLVFTGGVYKKAK